MLFPLRIGKINTVRGLVVFTLERSKEPAHDALFRPVTIHPDCRARTTTITAATAILILRRRAGPGSYGLASSKVIL